VDHMRVTQITARAYQRTGQTQHAVACRQSGRGVDQNSSSRREAGAGVGLAPRLSELGHVAGAVPQAATDAAIPGCLLHDPHHCGYSKARAHLRPLWVQVQHSAQRRGFGAVSSGGCSSMADAEPLTCSSRSGSGVPAATVRHQQWRACSYSEASIGVPDSRVPLTCK
jgi:hypothetical protein